MKSTRKRTIPDWIKMQIPGGDRYKEVKQAVQSRELNTVCIEARCPNIGDCLCNGTATFIIMGSRCTRNCRYCAVESGTGEPLRPDEPLKIAEAVAELKLSYAVITSVTRDDLPDGGASHFASVVREIRKLNPECGIEVLVPDFKAVMQDSADKVIAAGPDIFNHNIEVVRALFPEVRPAGDYEASIRLLQYAASQKMRVKSGLMIGMGESEPEIIQTLKDLRRAGVSIVTIGQYLRSHKNNPEVARYYRPEDFERFKELALELGFKEAVAGPMVRSSWHAAEASGWVEAKKRKGAVDEV